MKKLFACGGSAQVVNGENVINQVLAFGISAENEKEAEKAAWDIVLEKLPVKEGYINHAVSVCEIEQDFLKQCCQSC